MRQPDKFLVAGAALSAIGALLHLACIVFGGPWYRALGAGDRMARMADAGHWYPTVAAVVIAAVLLVWAAYALSAAGAIRKLPLTRLALCLITGVYLLRGIAFPVLMPYFPGNSTAFWIASSATCLLIGLLHLIGLRRVWGSL